MACQVNGQEADYVTFDVRRSRCDVHRERSALGIGERQRCLRLRTIQCDEQRPTLDSPIITTVKIRSRRMEDAYNGLRSALIHSVYKTKLGYALVNALKEIIKPVYTRLNSSPLIKEDIPDEEIEYLKEAYAREAEDLASLTGLDVPWGVKTPI